MIPSDRRSPHNDHDLREAVEDEESSGIRSRLARLSEPPASMLQPAERNERLEQKVRLARLLVDHLAPHDPKLRLLRLAVVRRDETLLDGVLADLNRRAREAAK